MKQILMLLPCAWPTGALLCVGGRTTGHRAAASPGACWTQLPLALAFHVFVRDRTRITPRSVVARHAHKRVALVGTMHRTQVRTTLNLGVTAQHASPRGCSGRAQRRDCLTHTPHVGADSVQRDRPHYGRRRAGEHPHAWAVVCPFIRSPSIGPTFHGDVELGPDDECAS
ncbi:hypothetical protein OH77DRAFT_1424640 [Trametes cingulata]|nr:hypothetical protein OH77DRAFT_1424640 [Trametes cingulata]